MRGMTGSEVVQVRTSFAGVFRARVFGLGTSWALTACILQACGGEVSPVPGLDAPVAIDAAADMPDAADADAAADVAADVRDAATDVCYPAYQACDPDAW